MQSLITESIPDERRSQAHKHLKIAMIGAGSAFSVNVAETLDHPVFEDADFWLMDTDEASLRRAEGAVRPILAEIEHPVDLKATTRLSQALDGADYVIVSCEQNRYPNWIKDIQIPEKHGVEQLTGENGGPGGQIHAMRNINMLMPIVARMEALCPDAWLLNLTNPMSVLTTYLSKYTSIKNIGFCHQVHGSIGVIAEQLGFEPGELEVVSGGINHLNWLFDIRKRGSRESCLAEFIASIRSSKWWKENKPHHPEHVFSLEIFDTFGMYPIGYDNHICEYFSCFYEKKEWKEKGFVSLVESRLLPQIQSAQSTLEAQHLMGGTSRKYPFPKDPHDPYYRESVSPMIVALETNNPTYFEAMVGLNEGAISNLPADAVVDRPVMVTGGQVRSVHVGSLPMGPLEVARRQISLHEMVVKATVDGDEKLAVQALCLDPYVKSITQAKAIWNDFKKEYGSYLGSFQ
jgi:alpha-galactosidase